jgi:hypothetical protein
MIRSSKLTTRLMAAVIAVCGVAAGTSAVVLTR